MIHMKVVANVFKGGWWIGEFWKMFCLRWSKWPTKGKKIACGGVGGVRIFLKGLGVGRGYDIFTYCFFCLGKVDLLV